MMRAPTSFFSYLRQFFLGHPLLLCVALALSCSFLLSPRDCLRYTPCQADAL